MHYEIERAGLGREHGPDVGTLRGTVKLSSKGTEKRRRSSALWPHAAVSAPVISAQIAKACARTARYSAAGR
jgi:hypothetical protein